MVSKPTLRKLLDPAICNFEDDAMFCVLETSHRDEHRFLYVIDTEHDGTTFRLLTHDEYRAGMAG